MPEVNDRGAILLVDDEPDGRQVLQSLLERKGYSVQTAADGTEALERLAQQVPDVIVTDLRMPAMDGVELLRRVKATHDDLPVVVMTAFGAIEGAIDAMRAGAEDYLQKPVHLDELLLALDQALQHRRVREEVRVLRGRLGDKLRPANILGESSAMQAVFKTVAQVAPTRASVLITGESGTGKELIAQALHDGSPRRAGPFVKLHCAALVESLLESELFGHERGSFTGAAGRREGRFKQADGGTLFLDEVGEIPPGIQIKLLRFLQERTFERVGSNETLKVDVRILAASNRSLEREVREGRFREDLFYRLNVVAIEMPPLRLRSADVLLLADHFLKKYASENGKVIEAFAPDAIARLQEYSWPGNVRELENAVERAVVLAERPRIGASLLPTSLSANPLGGVSIPGSTFADIERHAILSTLEAVGGSTTRAARMLDLSVRTIQYRLHQYGLAKHPGAKSSMESSASETGEPVERAGPLGVRV